MALCKRCLQFDPADRPATGAAVAAEVARLRRAADDRARQAERDKLAAEVRSAERRKRRGVAAALAGMIVAAVAAGGTVSARQWWRAKESELAAANARADAAGEAKARTEDRYRGLIATSTARGDSWAILKAYPQARTEGVALGPGVLPDYINAVAAVYGSDRVLAELDAVPRDGVHPADRPRLDLWRATCLFGTDDAAADRHLAAALAGPLPPAEEAFARGLRAPGIVAATAEYRRAVDLDPLYQPARSAACLALFLQGRVEESVMLAEESARLSPRRLDFPFLLATASLLREDDAQFTAAVDRLGPLAPAEHVRMMIDLRPMLANAWSQGRAIPTAPALVQERKFLALAQVVKSAKSLSWVSGLLPLSHRKQCHSYTAAAVHIQPITSLVFPGPTPTPKRLATNAEAVPEALLLLAAADAHLERALAPDRPPAARTTDFLAAASLGERGSRAPCLFLPCRVMALDVAIASLASAGRSNYSGMTPDPAASKRAAALLRRRLNEFGPALPDNSMMMVKVAGTAAT